MAGHDKQGCCCSQCWPSLIWPHCAPGTLGPTRVDTATVPLQSLRLPPWRTSSYRCKPNCKAPRHSQGSDQIRAGSQLYGWNVDLGAMTTIWRGGCIIRARFLDRIRQAYGRDADLPSLLVDQYFSGVLGDAQDAWWRRVVCSAVKLGVPVPGFASSLAYYDGLRRERLPAALVQGLRDLFGAHTYSRTDRAGTFHTLWSGDGSQVRQDDTPHSQADTANPH